MINLYCIFVNNGLLRKNEFQNVLDQYKGMGLNVKGVDAADRFLDQLEGIEDPELKRKAIGRVFIEVFDLFCLLSFYGCSHVIGSWYFDFCQVICTR